MKLTLLLVSLFSSGILAEPLWNTVLQKFSQDPDEGYWPMPLTVSEAESEGWVEPPEDLDITDRATTERCYHEDPAICLLYDNNGFIAGMSIGLIRDLVDDCSFSFKKPPFIPATKFGFPLYTITVYIVDQETIQSGGRTNLDGGTGNGLWILNGTELVNVPTKESVIRRDTLFTLEPCNPGMGDHYYYNISPDMDCQDFFPIFTVFKQSQMIGFGMHTFGNHTVFPNSRDWYDFALPIWIKDTLPNANQCLIDVSAECGINSVHFFFIKDARYTKCPTNSTET